MFMFCARKALTFNVHAVSVSTTSAHGRIRTGVSNLIMTALGLASRRVALLSSPTTASVAAPRIAPAIINCQFNPEVIVDARKVRPPHKISEWIIAFWGIADFVLHHACALFSRLNLWIGLPHRPAVRAGARINADRIRPSNCEGSNNASIAPNVRSPAIPLFANPERVL
tara:strand:+ start:371 stop:880 length:510 start_codon:yes stop_codon:yes gene_type:complete